MNGEKRVGNREERMIRNKNNKKKKRKEKEVHNLYSKPYIYIQYNQSYKLPYTVIFLYERLTVFVHLVIFKLNMF